VGAAGQAMTDRGRFSAPVGVLIVLMGLVLALGILLGALIGRGKGMEGLCADQFKGVMVEGICVSRESLKPVRP
jgi:hypothetical protein